MGKIVATYHVKVTLREPEFPGEPLVEGGPVPEPAPTIERLEAIVKNGLEANDLWAAHVSAERTDI